MSAFHAALVSAAAAAHNAADYNEISADTDSDSDDIDSYHTYNAAAVIALEAASTTLFSVAANAAKIAKAATEVAEAMLYAANFCKGATATGGDISLLRDASHAAYRAAAFAYQAAAGSPLAAVHASEVTE